MQFKNGLVPWCLSIVDKLDSISLIIFSYINQIDYSNDNDD